MQYTIRGIPAAVDRAVRERARADGQSLNEAVIEALAEGCGVAAGRQRRHFDDIAGRWTPDKAVEAALAAQDDVADGAWR
jgi:hypothetical protein